MYKIGICSQDASVEKAIIKMCSEMVKIRGNIVKFHVFSSAEEIGTYRGSPFIFLFLDMKRFPYINVWMYQKLQTLAQIVIVLNQLGSKNGFDGNIKMNMLPVSRENIIMFKRCCPEGAIPESAIRYLHSESNYVRVYLNGKTLLFAKTLKYMQQRLVKSDIIRIHKSVMVNLAYVDGIRNNHVILYDKTCLPIGRTYKKKVYRLVVAYKYGK